MTLCAVWRDEGSIHMASDSCLTIGPGKTANIGIKVTRDRFAIHGPADPSRLAVPLAAGDIAFCFAGMETGAVHLKESLTGIFGDLQAIPGRGDARFENVARLAFSAYKVITRALSAAIAQKGFYRIVVAGKCPADGQHKAFCFSTKLNEAAEGDVMTHHMDEILTGTRNYLFLGNGTAAAKKLAAPLRRPLTSRDILGIVQSVIDDDAQPMVAGNLQYGRFEDADFRLFAVLETSPGVHHWRGALDLRSEAFEQDFTIGYPLISRERFDR